jgi:hypothetical protein
MEGFISMYRGMRINVTDSLISTKEDLDSSICTHIKAFGSEPSALNISSKYYAELWALHLIDYIPIIKDELENK